MGIFVTALLLLVVTVTANAVAAALGADTR
jgi:hypothetical protein